MPPFTPSGVPKRLAQDPCWRPAVFQRLRRHRHGACASRMTQTPPPATTSRSRKRFVTSGQLNPSPTGGPAWPQQRKTSGRVGHPVERDGQRALFNVAPQTQSKQLSPCEFMQPLPTPRSRCPPAPSSRSPAPSPIKTGLGRARSAVNARDEQLRSERVALVVRVE